MKLSLSTNTDRTVHITNWPDIFKASKVWGLVKFVVLSYSGSVLVPFFVPDIYTLSLNLVT